MTTTTHDAKQQPPRPEPNHRQQRRRNATDESEQPPGAAAPNPTTMSAERHTMNGITAKHANICPPHRRPNMLPHHLPETWQHLNNHIAKPYGAHAHAAAARKTPDTNNKLTKLDAHCTLSWKKNNAVPHTAGQQRKPTDTGPQPAPPPRTPNFLLIKHTVS